MSINRLLTRIGVIQMSKGYSFYYRLECIKGFRNNQIYEDKTFAGLYKKFYNINYKVRNHRIKEFVKMYDSGSTNAYYHIHCVFVYPDGSEKIIYTCEGLK